LNALLNKSGREEQAMMTTLAGLVVVLMMIVKEIANLFDAVKTLFQFKISQRRMIKWKYFRLSDWLWLLQ